MKSITKYVATDGSEWNTAAQCLRRDALDAKVRAIEDTLGPPCRRGRLPVNQSVVALAKAAVVMICREEFPAESVFQHDPAKIAAMSYAGRFLDEVGGPLRRIWGRFMCINGDWEYEQPFYALHPDEFNGPESATALDAVDPSAADPGTPTTRA